MSSEDQNAPLVSAGKTSVVRRVSELLAAFGEKEDELEIGQLVRRTGIPKATVSRLVKDLTTVGLLERRGSKVCLGLRLFELGERASRCSSLREVALPFLADLREATGQTVHLAVLDGVEVVYLEKVRGRNAPRLPSAIGSRLPAHATGVGKALLAAAGPEVLDVLLASNPRRLGPHTIIAPDALSSELRCVATRNIAYEREESAPNVACVASAVRTGRGQSVAAVSASGWIEKVDIRRIEPAVRATAQSIGRALNAYGTSRPN